MPKKAKSESGEQRPPQGIFESAHEIWLAGLGALYRAQDEGNKFFESLVKEGEEVEARSKQAADEQIEEVRGRATDTWDKLEHVFQDRVSRSLHLLGVPTREDIDALSRRIEDLNDAVRELSKPKRRSTKTGGTQSGKAKSKSDTE